MRCWVVEPQPVGGAARAGTQRRGSDSRVREINGVGAARLTVPPHEDRITVASRLRVGSPPTTKGANLRCEANCF